MDWKEPSNRFGLYILREINKNCVGFHVSKKIVSRKAVLGMDVWKEIVSRKAVLLHHKTH
jgi:hypothetical protein